MMPLLYYNMHMQAHFTLSLSPLLASRVERELTEVLPASLRF